MGSPKRELVTFFRTKINPNSHPELARQALKSRKKASSETGDMMKFGERSHRALTVYDAYELGGKGYPVSKSILESLPAYIRADLERDGNVQILTHYDTEKGQFTHVSLANEPTPDELVARIALFLDKGLSFYEIMDYLVVKELGHYSVEQWASIRNVRPDSVQEHVRDTGEEIEDIL